MEAKGELEAEVDDLESRIDRLRALYEQYFMGLEKMEPATLRGEVDRKLWAMRKKRIQNTGLRYRLQMLIQRYNTFQQYWQRITREMERGTYMRDVLRVARRIGSEEAVTIVGRRRAKMFRQLAKSQEDRRAKLTAELGARAKANAQANDRANDQEEEPEEIQLSDDAVESDPGLDAEQTATPLAAVRPLPPKDQPNLRAATPVAGEPGFEDPSTWNLLDELSSHSPAPPPARVRLDSAAPADDDMPTLPPPPPGAAGARILRVPVEGTITIGERLRAPLVPRDAAAQEEPPAKSPAAPTAPAPLAQPPQPPQPPARRPPPLPRRGTSTTLGIGPPVVPGSSGNANAGRAMPARANEAAGAPSAPRAEGNLRRVYDQYVAAKRTSNEPTDGLTYEKLQRSLARQEEQLRAKHGDRQIDFEVVTQDGRTRIRPVIR